MNVGSTGRMWNSTPPAPSPSLALDSLFDEEVALATTASPRTPLLSPPAWMRAVATAKQTPEDIMTVMDQSIRAEAKSRPREAREAREAAAAVFDRLQEDTQKRSVARSTAASAADDQQRRPQQIQWTTGPGPQSYQELLYAEGMLSMAERTRWISEAEAVLQSHELAECTFTPEMSERSLELVAEMRAFDELSAKPLDERVSAVIAEQRLRRQILSEQVETAQRHEMRRPSRPSPRPQQLVGSPYRNNESFLEAQERRAVEARLAKQELCNQVHYGRVKHHEKFRPAISPRSEELVRQPGARAHSQPAESRKALDAKPFMAPTSAAQARQYRGPTGQPASRERRSSSDASAPAPPSPKGVCSPTSRASSSWPGSSTGTPAPRIPVPVVVHDLADLSDPDPPEDGRGTPPLKLALAASPKEATASPRPASANKVSPLVRRGRRGDA